MNVLTGGSAIERFKGKTMTKKLGIYKCEKCGNIIEILHAGKGEISCCNEPMKLYNANTVDAAKEKHVPVAESKDKQVKVKVGSVAHPMEDGHYIEWIEIINNSKTQKAFLEPGQNPEAVFNLDSDNFIIRAYCNKHRLWKG